MHAEIASIVRVTDYIHIDIYLKEAFRLGARIGYTKRDVREIMYAAQELTHS